MSAHSVSGFTIVDNFLRDRMSQSPTEGKVPPGVKPLLFRLNPKSGHTDW